LEGTHQSDLKQERGGDAEYSMCLVSNKRGIMPAFIRGVYSCPMSMECVPQMDWDFICPT